MRGVSHRPPVRQPAAFSHRVDNAPAVRYDRGSIIALRPACGGRPDRGRVAQVVEHRAENAGVDGSTPAPTTVVVPVGCRAAASDLFFLGGAFLAVLSWRCFLGGAFLAVLSWRRGASTSPCRRPFLPANCDVSLPPSGSVLFSGPAASAYWLRSPAAAKRPPAGRLACPNVCTVSGRSVRSGCAARRTAAGRFSACDNAREEKGRGISCHVPVGNIGVRWA